MKGKIPKDTSISTHSYVAFRLVPPEWTKFRELGIKINSYTGIDYTCDWNPGPSKQPNN